MDHCWHTGTCRVVVKRSLSILSLHLLPTKHVQIQQLQMTLSVILQILHLPIDHITKYKTVELLEIV